MAALGELVVSLSANTAKFSEGLNRAEFQTQKAFSKMKSTIGMLGPAIAGAFTTQAIFEFSKAAILAADAINDVAKANDVAVSSVLSLSRALSLNGGEASSAANLFASLTKAIDAAADGSEKSQKSFKEVGVTLNDLATLDGQEIFNKTIEGLGQIEDPVKRNALAMELLGKSVKGVDIAGLADDFKNGKGDFADSEKAFNDIGTAMDKLDKMQMDLSTHLATALGPALLKTIEIAEDIGPKFLEAIPVLGTMIKLINQLNESNANVGKQSASGRIRKANEPIIRTVIDPAAEKAEQEADARRKAAAREMASFRKKLSDEKLRDLQDEINFELEMIEFKNKKELDAEREKEEERRQIIAENVQNQIEFNEEVERIKDSVDPTRAYTREIQKLAQMFEMGRITAEEFSIAAGNAQKNMLSFQESTTDGFEELKNAIEGFSRDAASSLVDFAFGASTSFEQMANDFAKAIARMIIQKQLLDPLFNGISQSMAGGGSSGLLDSLVGSFATSFFGGSGGVMPSADAGAYSIDQNPYLNYGGARALGGPVSSNKAYLVGENGPEIFMPTGSGSIVPNNKVGGGVSVTNVFHLSGPADMRTQQQIASSAYSGALRAARRNG